MGAAPPPELPARRRRRFYARLALMAAAACVGLVLFLATVFVPPFLHARSPSAANPGLPETDLANASFSQDRVVAESWAANVSGGPWVLVGGEAITSPVPVSVPLDDSGASGCPLIPQPYPSRSSVAFPGLSVVDGFGRAPLWTYDFASTAGGGLRVAVDDGNASTLGLLDLSPPDCPAAFSGAVAVPEALLDSTGAGAAALSLGGESFLASYPDASISYALEPLLEPGAGGLLADAWNVTFNGCGPASMAGSYDGYAELWTIWLDARTGALEATNSSVISCPAGSEVPLPYPLGEDLTFNHPVASASGETLYVNTSVAAVCCGLTPSNLSAALHPVGDAPIPAHATLAILDSTGGVDCTAAMDAEAVFPLDCSNPLLAGDLFSVALPASGNGQYELAIDGLWEFDGEIDIPLYAASPV